MTDVPFPHASLLRCAAERPFRVRVRAVNARGKSAWSKEQLACTRQVPTRCGGKACSRCALAICTIWCSRAPVPPDQGPGYTWDQTPESVEAQLAVPEGIAARDVRVDVKPTRMRVMLRDAVLLEGRLCGEVRAADEGDWEWELAGDSDARHVALTLSKRCVLGCCAYVRCDLAHACASRHVSYDPAEQWCCLLEGDVHPKIDTARMTWVRDRPWRPPQDARTLVRHACRLE